MKRSSAVGPALGTWLPRPAMPATAPARGPGSGPVRFASRAAVSSPSLATPLLVSGPLPESFAPFRVRCHGRRSANRSGHAETPETGRREHAAGGRWKAPRRPSRCGPVAGRRPAPGSGIAPASGACWAKGGADRELRGVADAERPDTWQDSRRLPVVSPPPRRRCVGSTPGERPTRNRAASDRGPRRAGRLRRDRGSPRDGLPSPSIDHAALLRRPQPVATQHRPAPPARCHEEVGRIGAASHQERRHNRHRVLTELAAKP